MKRVLIASMFIAPFLAAACSSSSSSGQNPPPPPVSSGGTGAFGIVTVNGTQKLYLPQNIPNTSGHGFISVVDLGVPGNGVAGAPALITNIDLGTSDVATTTNGTSSVVIAASTTSSKVWLIDPTSDTVTKTITLDPSYGASNFSGGGGVVTGIAMDPTNNRAILSVWNGFALLDLGAGMISQVILAPPAENFGFDSVNERIIAPFYDCQNSMSGVAEGGLPMPPPFCNNYLAPDGMTPMTDGLNVIDLKDGTVYTYQDPMGGMPASPVGFEPDSAAADPSTGLIVVPSESGGYQNVIDLSKATFDKAKKTVTAPHEDVQNVGLTGVAIEATNHFAFWEEEHGGSVALANLNALNPASAVEGGAPSNVVATANMPSVPGGVGWGNLGDPHGVAVATGIANGHPIGVVVDSGLQWVARIDLQAMWALPRMADPLNPTASIMDSDMAKVVTMLDALTKR